MIKSLLLSLLATIFSVSCAVVPVVKPHSPRDIECGISSHEYDSKMVEMGHISASCNSLECIVSIGVFAAAWTGVTAIVSGSVVLIGNTVHWLEQLGPCDKDTLNKQVVDVTEPLIKQGGKRVIIKEYLEEK